MQKVFFISRSTDKGGSAAEYSAPDFDRFQRVEQLNGLLDLGWQIKEFKTDNGDAYFILEKD